jgi:hypothetical protein
MPATPRRLGQFGTWRNVHLVYRRKTENPGEFQRRWVQHNTRLLNSLREPRRFEQAAKADIRLDDIVPRLP